MEFIARLLTEPGLEHDRQLLDRGYDIWNALDCVLDTNWNRFSRTCYRHTSVQFGPWVEAALAAGPDSAFLELGCGSWNPLGLAFLGIASGFERSGGLDLNAPSNPSRALKVLADLAGMLLVDPASVLGEGAPSASELLKRFDGFDFSRLRHGDPSGLASDRLVHLQAPADATGIDGPRISMTHSTSFLEHVLDLDAVVTEIARITRKGGFAVHVIDATDHRKYSDPAHGPLDYLAEPVEGECVDVPFRSHPGRRMEINRLRPHEFVPRFERAGFELVDYEVMRRVEVDDALRSTFVEPYRSMSAEEVGVLGARLVMRRR